MSKVYLHSKDDLSKIVLKYLICLIPLIIYGIYKNGFLLYQKDIITFFSIFKILYLIILSIIAYGLGSIILKHKLNFDLSFLSCFIVPLFMPLNINLVLYFIAFLICFIICNIINKWLNINEYAFIKLGIIIIAMIFSNFSYLNALESANIYSFSIWDLLWGRNIGGIASTSIIFGLVFLIYNTFCNNYKWSIAVWGVVSFLIVFLLLDGMNVDGLTNSSAILAFIIIAPDSRSTPVKFNMMFLFSSITGILAAILTKYVNIYEGTTMSILLMSFLYSLFAKSKKR